MRILRSITIKKASSRRSLMSLCHKTISSCCSCAYVEILSTWEVWRALKWLEMHSAAPRATLTPLSCSPNFPRAQYLNIRTLMHELIVKYIRQKSDSIENHARLFFFQKGKKRAFSTLSRPHVRNLFLLTNLHFFYKSLFNRMSL